MTDRETLHTRFAEAVQAADEIERWSAGAQALALLTAVHERGWTRFLSTPQDLDGLAEFAKLPLVQLEEVVDTLQAHGVVRRDGTSVRLSPPFEALAADDAWLGLSDVVDNAAMTSQLIHEAILGAGAPRVSDALVAARAAGGRPTPVTTALFEELLEGLPEWREVMRAGRRLDVGSGVATTTLTLASMFPDLQTTAIEVVPEVAAEARQRAERLGLADRVGIRNLDARDFTAEAAFDSAFWAQHFFPEPTRAATLAMIRRALRPGAVLTVPEEDAGLQDTDQRSRTLRQLLRRHWGAPLDRSTDQLAAEAVAAGFTLVRTAPTSFGRFVLLRRPAGS
jgi:predicted O-methyltransferase YrrM